MSKKSQTSAVGENSVVENNAASARVELVLGGGGVKGYGHIGVLKALHERDIKIGMVTGVSIGSVVAVLYRNGYSPDEILDLMLDEFGAFNDRVFGPQVNGKRKTGWLSVLGGLDLSPFFKEIIEKHELKPRRNLRLVAFDAIMRRPVLFEGLNYDLHTALSASCSIPFVMKPIWQGDWQRGKTVRTVVNRIRGRATETVLVDGGLYHPAPTNFARGLAIVSRLGTATKMSNRSLPLAERLFQRIEISGGNFLRRYFPADDTHIIIHSGKPDVGTLSFDVDREHALEMVEHAYNEASKALDEVIASGKLPPTAIRARSRKARTEEARARNSRSIA